MRSKLQLLSLVAALIGMSAGVCNANGLSLTATSLYVSSGHTPYDTLRFTITWNNSWYNTTVPTVTSPTPANYDAVWVFAKYQDCSANTWSHVHLSGVNGMSTVTDGLQADPVSDSMGVFIHLSSAGSGRDSGVVTLLYNTTTLTGTSPFNFKVFGIEMVQIPTDSFQVGDGAAVNRFNSVNIGSEASISLSTLGGNIYSAGLPAAYPKGYHQMYCMKYEISSSQYVDFLNTLTYAQQTTYTSIAPNTLPSSSIWALGGLTRNSIVIVTPGYSPTQTPAVYGNDLLGTVNGANAGQDVAENYMSWSDLLGYLDWAALRPMSDLEYEKICRGGPPSIVQRQAGEYVWATGNINAVAASAATGYGTISEVPSAPSTTAGNSCINYTNSYYCGVADGNNLPGPMRCGFAATSSTTRQTAGATYWGILDMAGNVYEEVVASATLAATNFQGTLGNGNLSSGLPSDWPAVNTSMYYRGGGYDSALNYAQTSDRSGYASGGLGRTCDSGGRGVRQY